MIVLGIETATEHMSASLIFGDNVHSRGIVSKSSHCELLAGFIFEISFEAGIMVNYIEGIAVSIGPGSFTGLRIGVSTAMGLAYGLGVDVAGVNTLMGLTQSGDHPGEMICPVIDAKRGEIYTALYKIGEIGSIPETIIPPSAIQIEKLDELLPHDTRIVFTGPSIDKFRTQIENLRVKEKIFLSHEKSCPTADNIAKLGAVMFEKGMGASPSAVEPVYLRRSDAELAKDICRIKHK